jgi:two-component system alkaline phosphatase synthesis response regulator PhoP
MIIYPSIFLHKGVPYYVDMKRVLIIEDDDRIFDLISMHLSDLDFETEHAKEGPLGLKKALEKEYDLIVLDLTLPKLDGLEVCKRIRDANKHVPLLIVTARSEELDKVLGLELGADDYITKPFGIREFIARVKALMRRVEVDRKLGTTETEVEKLEYGPLIINCTYRTVLIDGKRIDLTNKEYDLLELLARNPGRAFNRQQLLDTVWGYQYEGYNHTVNSHINRLRSKIEDDPSNPTYVQTLWGYGYRFMDGGGKKR